jgi:hypothetical protein
MRNSDGGDADTEYRNGGNNLLNGECINISTQAELRPKVHS